MKLLNVKLMSFAIAGLALAAPLTYAADDLSKTSGDRNEVGTSHRPLTRTA